MEREEIFGAIIVLIIIIVIALIVYNMYGSAGQDVKQIADEVFGWTKGDQKLEAERIGEADSSRFMDRLIQIYENSFTAEQGCTYDLKGYDLSDKFKVEIVYLNNKDTVLKFNLIKVEDDTLVSSKTLDKKQDDWKLEPCYMEETTKSVQGGNTIPIATTNKLELTVGTKKFYNNLPKFYKYNQNRLCFITQGSRDEKTYQEQFLKAKDCETKQTNGAELAKNFFSNFIASVRACKPLSKGIECKCDLIDFKKLPVGGSIKATQNINSIKFELYFNNQKITEQEVPDTEGVSVTSSLIKKEPNYEKWTQPVTFDQDTNQLYITLTTQPKELGFAWPSAVTPPSILTLLFKNRIKSCAPAYDTPDVRCTRRMDPNLVANRIKENKYDQIIMKASQDEKDRLLTAAIIATESAGRNDAVSQSGCSGLMQFCGSTAKGFSAPCDTGTCYVCDPKGCNLQDNRGKPEIAIPAGLKLLQAKISAIDKCAGVTTYREVFGLAAYNAGEGVICAAIKATGKQDPTWEEVKKKIDTNLLRGYYSGPYWTKDTLNAKVIEIACYPYYVESYKTGFTGMFNEQKT